MKNLLKRKIVRTPSKREDTTVTKKTPPKHRETMRLGDVQTIFTWDGVRRRPTVTHSKTVHTIPQPSTLDSVITDEEMQR